MKPDQTSNLYPVQFSSQAPVLFRAPRDRVESPDRLSTVAWHSFLYSETRLPASEQIDDPDPEIVARFLRIKLSQALATNSNFFDIGRFGLSASIGGNLLHREASFSIATAVELQFLFKDRSIFLAVLPSLRVYNRVRLPEIHQIIGERTLRLPVSALCFTGATGDERWQDCLLIGFADPSSCVVRLRSQQPSELTLSTERVIPKLPLSLIKHVARSKGSSTQIDRLIRQFRRKQSDNEGLTVHHRAEEVREHYVARLFPFRLGESEVSLGQTAATFGQLDATCIPSAFSRISQANGHSEEFQSVAQGLRQTRFDHVRDCPVAVFCTAATRASALQFLHELNTPTDNFAGFQGMPVHFGIRLMPAVSTPFVAKTVDEYVDLANQFTLSAVPTSQPVLGLFVLADDDEPYTHPVPLYYRIKALMARTGFASQVVEPSTLSEKYARFNLALQLAAKLGAVPWTLADSKALEPVDLFLGFSYSWINTDSLGESRNIGYVNVFDRDGTWRVLCADSVAFSFDQRVTVFPKLAGEAVRSATDKPADLRMIEVHYNKRFGKAERRAIVDGIRKYAPQAAVLFVSISGDHPVRLFDGGRPQMSAARGTVMSLDARTSYIQTINASPQTGLPRPLRCQTYSDFCHASSDTNAIATRILALSELNWRSMHDFAALPVTILYSSLVARLANYFSLTDWNQFVDHQLKRTPWFL